MLVFLLAGMAASNDAGNIPPRILHFAGTLVAPKDAKDRDEKEKNFTGTVRARLTFNPRGRVIHCDVVASAAADWVNDMSCKFLSTAIAVPAKNAIGNATYGAVTRGILYLGENKVDVPVSADLSVAVNHMPANAPESVTETASVVIDASGSAGDCAPYKSDNKYPDLDKATCQLAMRRISFQPTLNEANVPIPSVQLFSVEFSAADAPVHRISRPLILPR